MRPVAALVVLAFLSALLTPGALKAAPAPATASRVDRAPIAILWMGEDDGDLASRIVDEVNGALARKVSVRPIDSAEDRRVLAEGGPGARIGAKLRLAEGALARGKLADSAQAFEAAEAQLFADVPFDTLRTHLAEVERGLLAVYDQLGRNADAARAAARLRMAPGSIDDVRVLLARHAVLGLVYGAPLPPVEVVSQPPGAQVYRNLQPIGITPLVVDGGDRAIDFVDIEAPGHRRVHVALGMGGRIEVVLSTEDRLGVLVDRIRDQAPDAPAAEVAALGKRLGAVRVLAILPDGPRKVLARWLDVGKARWSESTLRVDNAGEAAIERLAGYAAPGEAQGAGAQLGTPAAPAPELASGKKKLGMWGKWYTWVAAAGVVALVAGLLVAQNVGDDKLTVTATK